MAGWREKAKRARKAETPRDLIEKGTAAEAHPSMWAPFVVVGEGAASK